MITPVIFVQGTMPASSSGGPATVFSSSTDVYLTGFKIFNSTTAFQYAEIYTFVLNATRSYARIALSQSYSADVLDTTLVLTSGSAILLQSTSGSVEFQIDGGWKV